MQEDSELQLLVWFVNQGVHGEEASYPLLLTCQLQQPWNPREIVCEANYMEVRQERVIAEGWLSQQWSNGDAVTDGTFFSFVSNDGGNCGCNAMLDFTVYL